MGDESPYYEQESEFGKPRQQGGLCKLPSGGYVMNLTRRDEFIKASPAIQVQSKMTLLQRRAWNVLLANAYDDLPNTDIYRVSVAELGAKLGFNSKNENYLKEILEALVDCKVKWNVLDKNKEEEWGVAVSTGICRYKKRCLHLRVRAASALETA